MRLVENVRKFAMETSIHGLLHIAKPSSSTAKRITWLILFTLSMLYASIQIGYEAMCKYIQRYWFIDEPLRE